MATKSYDPKSPPKGLEHKELTNGSCVVMVMPKRWSRYNSDIIINEAVAYCKTCDWDTPILFSMSAVEAAAKEHLARD
jgi:hypothetical protein